MARSSPFQGGELGSKPSRSTESKKMDKVIFWIKQKGLVNLGLAGVALFLFVAGLKFFAGGFAGFFVCRNYNAIKNIWKTDIRTLIKGPKT